MLVVASALTFSNSSGDINVAFAERLRIAILREIDLSYEKEEEDGEHDNNEEGSESNIRSQVRMNRSEVYDDWGL